MNYMNIEKTILLVLKAIVVVTISSILLCLIIMISTYLFLSGNESQTINEYYYELPDSNLIRVVYLGPLERVVLTNEERIDKSDVLRFNHPNICLINNNFKPQWEIPFHCKDGHIEIFWTYYNSWSRFENITLSNQAIYDYMGKLKEATNTILFDDDYRKLTLEANGHIIVLQPTHQRTLSARRKDIILELKHLQSLGI